MPQMLQILLRPVDDGNTFCSHPSPFMFEIKRYIFSCGQTFKILRQTLFVSWIFLFPFGRRLRIVRNKLSFMSFVIEFN